MNAAGHPFDSTSVVVARKDALGAEVRGEFVILDPTSGKYFGLNSVGGFIWQQLQQPLSVEQVVERVRQRYDVDSEMAERDVMALLAQLSESNLIDFKG
jgi:hypothetical protein